MEGFFDLVCLLMVLVWWAIIVVGITGKLSLEVIVGGIGMFVSLVFVELGLS